jgi:hypothetical protein
MTDQAGPELPVSAAAAPAQPAKPAGKARSWLTRIVYGVASIVFILLSLVRIYNFFFPSLPDCDGSTAHETLTSILKKDNLDPASYTGEATLTKSEDELTCKANVKMADGSLLQIAYRIYWEGKDRMAQITQRSANQDQK